MDNHIDLRKGQFGVQEVVVGGKRLGEQTPANAQQHMTPYPYLDLTVTAAPDTLTANNIWLPQASEQQGEGKYSRKHNQV
jgi:hypothetical protein